MRSAVSEVDAFLLLEPERFRKKRSGIEIGEFDFDDSWTSIERFLAREIIRRSYVLFYVHAYRAQPQSTPTPHKLDTPEAPNSM